MNDFAFALNESSIAEDESSFQEMKKKTNVSLTVEIMTPEELKGLTPVLMQ